MKCITIISIFLIVIRLIVGGNQTQNRNDLYSHSISLTDIFSKQFALNKHVKNETKETNETDLEPIFKPDLYYRPLYISTPINTNITYSSDTIEDISTSVNTISFVNNSESLSTNDSVGSIVPAMPGIPIFREPPQIKIHDPDEGPLDPYYHPSNTTDFYPTTSVPDQQFIYMKRPIFEAEKGSLEEKYKQLLIDKEEDDITLPPGFDGQDFSNYTEIEEIIISSTSTIKPVNASTTEKNFQSQIPYPYNYPYNPYMYGFQPFIPNYNFPYLPPLYSAYGQNLNYRKQESELKTEIPEVRIKPNIEEENIDPRYGMLPKSYAPYGAHIEQVSVEEKSSKDLTAGDSDSLEVFAPLELTQEKDGVNKVSQNVSDKITMNIKTNDNNKLVNEFLKISDKNNKTISTKSKSHDNREKNKKRYPRVREKSRRIRNKKLRIIANKNKSSKRAQKRRNNYKRIKTRLHKVLVNKNKTENKLPTLMNNDNNKNKFNINYDFNKPDIHFPSDTTHSEANLDLTTTSPSLISTIPTRNPSLMRRYNSRRMIARKQHNKPLIKKKLKNNHGVDSRQKIKYVKNSKSAKTLPSKSTRGQELNEKFLINKNDWRQTAIPKFLLRAKLRNVDQLKDMVTNNKWWLSEQPSLCLDPIYVVNDCLNKKLTKRWSYNANDQICYFYEDFCSHIKTNSFDTSQECFQHCWRDRKNNGKSESES